MKIIDTQTSNDLLQYIRTFKSWEDEDHIYDFNFVVHMMLAAMDNLQTNSTQTELEEIAYSFTDAQRKFIAQLAGYANRAIDEDTHT